MDRLGAGFAELDMADPVALPAWPSDRGRGFTIEQAPKRASGGREIDVIESVPTLTTA